MGTRPDPRRVARLTILPHLRNGGLGKHCVHVLDLSPLGARIGHQELLHDGVACYLDLPALRLTGWVAWTRLQDTERSLEGDRRSHYESGIGFTKLTAEQQTALMAVLTMLQSPASVKPARPVTTSNSLNSTQKLRVRTLLRATTLREGAQSNEVRLV